MIAMSRDGLRVGLSVRCGLRFACGWMCSCARVNVCVCAKEREKERERENRGVEQRRESSRIPHVLMRYNGTATKEERGRVPVRHRFLQVLKRQDQSVNEERERERERVTMPASKGDE